VRAVLVFGRPSVSDRRGIFKLPSPLAGGAEGEGIRWRAPFSLSQPFRPLTLVPAFGGSPNLDVGLWTYVQLSRE
jgi:hypothetical protein